MKKTILGASLMLLSLGAMAQEGVPFNGVVTDAAGRGMKKVRVSLVNRPDKRTYSDKKGRFGLTDVPAEDTLRIEWKRDVHYIPVAGRKSIRIFWKLNNNDFAAEEDKELVDFGYGFVKRREVTQSTSGISGEELRKTGATDLWSALQGRIAGLNISTSPVPGGESEINIRGQKSILGDTTPLFVVDGVIVDNLDYLNLEEVDYVEVMKEAGIYGSRGANGAILVRTRGAKSTR